MKFAAVAFDLDGTLYPDLSLFVRLVPFLAKEHRLLNAMNHARMRLRRTAAYEGDFYELQARIMAEILNEEPKKVLERLERLVYRGWEPFFKKIRLFPHVRETLDTFQKNGIRMGLLSDFPPVTKLDNLGILEYWDTVICSEQCGKLKPDPFPFTELVRKMALPAGDILYVGNSVPYDMIGARGVGMRTALVRAWSFSSGRRFSGVADFVFRDYRQLRDYVLG